MPLARSRIGNAPTFTVVQKEQEAAPTFDLATTVVCRHTHIHHTFQSPIFTHTLGPVPPGGQFHQPLRTCLLLNETVHVSILCA